MLYKLEDKDASGASPAQRYLEVVATAFSTTDTTVEVPTSLTEIEAVFATPKTVTYSANDQLSSDGVISSGAVTVARNASGTSALAIMVLFIGKLRAES